MLWSHDFRGKTLTDRYPLACCDCPWPEKSYICDWRRVTAGVLMWTGRVSRRRGKCRHCEWIMCQSVDVAAWRKVWRWWFLYLSLHSHLVIFSLPWSRWHRSNDTGGIQVTLWPDDSSVALSLTNQYLPGETLKYAERLMLKTYLINERSMPKIFKTLAPSNLLIAFYEYFI